MAITAAQVEANGWVLRLTLTGSLSSAIVSGYSLTESATLTTQWATNFSAYALAPNGATPAVTLAATTSGFVQSGGIAVASSTVARTLIALKTLRKIVNSTAAGVRDAKNPDEVDNGDGTITVRLALSQHVYAGDAGLTLAVLAGWRTGAAAQSAIAVTNNSTILAPAPIVRWTDVPYQLQNGSFALECAVASHHPKGLAPVAGVKFSVTDGTNTVTAWATALANSPVVPTADGTGQHLRVFTVTIDPTTATPAALTKGLLRCDFTAYPWIGPAQTSDPTGAKSMTSLGTAATATSAFVPFVVAYNPGGAWITPRYAYVNASTGSSTAAATNVSTNAATAAATPLASINLAIESLRLDAVAHTSYGTVAAANGQAAITQSLDGCRIRLAAGVVAGTGSTAVTAGAATGATWLVIEGDPADGNPRADCILRAPTIANGSSRVTRVKFSTLSVEAGTIAPILPTLTTAWLDNAELRGAQTPSDQRAATTIPFTGSASVLFVTNSKWWQFGLGAAVSGTQQNPVLLRNVSVERAMNAPAVFNCARLPSAPSSVTTGSSSTASGVYALTVATPSSDAGASLERMVVGCDLRYLNGAPGYLFQFLAAASVPTSAPYSTNALTLGTGLPVASRHAILGNVCEEIGSGGNPCFQSVGENLPSVSTENIIEGNTHTGDRTNNWYNDLNMATVALNDSALAYAQVNRLANNVYTKAASKHDEFNDPTVAQQRIGVGLPATRSKAYTAGTQIVVSGFAGTASISAGGVLAVTVVGSGALAVGSVITAGGAGPTVYGTIASLGTGIGGTGTYNLAAGFLTLASSAILVSGIATPANVYQCTTGGTTASTGGPTGTGSSIADGTVVWQWVATEARCHGYRPQAITSWSAHYGVGGEGNIDLAGVGDPAIDPNLIHETLGVGSDRLFDDGIAALTAMPWTTDLSGTPNRLGCQTLQTVGGGNYKPLTTGAGTYVLGRAKTANIDIDSHGTARTIPFAAGAIEGAVIVTLLPAGDRQASRAATSLTGWAATLAGAWAAMASRAAVSATGWTTFLSAAQGVMPTRSAATVTSWATAFGTAQAAMASRAANSGAGWTTVLGAAGGAMSTRAAATLVAWATTLGAAPAALASRAAGSLTGWTVALAAAAARLASLAATTIARWTGASVPDNARSATHVAATFVTWQGVLAADFDRSATLASAPIVTAAGSWVVLIDSGRIAMIDRTLPILLPGTTTPAERTLTVAGDFRVIRIF